MHTECHQSLRLSGSIADVSQQIPVSVQYRDGLSLTYLFKRSAKIQDVQSAVCRAGQVAKVRLFSDVGCADTEKLQ